MVNDWQASTSDAAGVLLRGRMYKTGGKGDRQIGQTCSNLKLKRKGMEISKQGRIIPRSVRMCPTRTTGPLEVP